VSFMKIGSVAYSLKDTNEFLPVMPISLEQLGAKLYEGDFHIMLTSCSEFHEERASESYN
jgi:hypothetical protein